MAPVPSVPAVFTAPLPTVLTATPPFVLAPGKPGNRRSIDVQADDPGCLNPCPIFKFASASGDSANIALNPGVSCVHAITREAYAARASAACFSLSSASAFSHSSRSVVESESGHNPNGSLRFMGSPPAYPYRLSPPASPIGSGCVEGPDPRIYAPSTLRAKVRASPTSV